MPLHADRGGGTATAGSELEKACRGNTFAQRRDAAVIAVFRATGVRLAELAGIRYYPGDPDRTDLDLETRQIKIRGKGGKDRIVKIDYEAARCVGRYLRVRARHAQSYRSQLWLGVSNRGPLTASGIERWSSGAAGSAAWMYTRTGSGTISATPGWTAAVRRVT